MATFLDFEKPIAELEARLAELRDTASASEPNIEAEIGRLQERAQRLLRDTYAKLTPWQKTQVARHPERPHFKDYVDGLIEDFVPLAGDRNFGDDQAILGGLASAAPGGTAAASSSSATRKATTPRAGSRTISEWPSPKAIARRSG